MRGVQPCSLFTERSSADTGVCTMLRSCFCHCQSRNTTTLAKLMSSFLHTRLSQWLSTMRVCSESGYGNGTLFRGGNHRIMFLPIGFLGHHCLFWGWICRSRLTFGSLVQCWGLSHDPSMEGSVPLAIFSHKKLCYSAQRNRRLAVLGIAQTRKWLLVLSWRSH